MASLFIGNLSKTVDPQKFSDIFKRIGSCKVEMKSKKGPYAFVEYYDYDNAKKAMKRYNKTNLNGINGALQVRIEISKKKKGEGDELCSQSLSNISQEEEVQDKNLYKNICFVCKLNGHIAKDCILRKDMCYECGEKGHVAKECKEKVREAKCLTFNRIKAIRSQQSEYKFVYPQIIKENLLLQIKREKEII